MPSGRSSAIERPIVSLWFALRAAVLRLAFTSLWTVALDKSRVVAAGVARRQNAAMVIRLNARPGPDMDFVLASAVRVFVAPLRG